MYKGIKKIHMVGIGGSGMSGIAEILVSRGYSVSGSDLAETDVTERLQRFGVSVAMGHDPKNISNAEVVVTSSAIAADNCEVLAARERSIPIVRRAEMLAELMRQQHGIAVSGSHGKTTTTSLIATLLHEAGLDPTVIVGGKLVRFDSHAHPGKGEFFVAEADESDRSFLSYSPTIAVVTNIDREHLDTYHNIADIKETFLAFLKRIPFYGLAVLWGDSTELMEICRRLDRRVVTYGFSTEATIRAENVTFDAETLQSRYDLMDGNKKIASIRLNLLGHHHVLNSLAAYAVGRELNLPINVFSDTMAAFAGVERRFQKKGEFGLGRTRVVWIDDYAHHPTEISAVLSAARLYWKGPVAVLFQPHRYTRTKALIEEFSRCFTNIDHLFITDIYPASEKPIPGVTSEWLISQVKNAKLLPANAISYVKDFSAFQKTISALNHDKLLFLTVGAGKIDRWGAELFHA